MGLGLGSGLGLGLGLGLPTATPTPTAVSAEPSCIRREIASPWTHLPKTRLVMNCTASSGARTEAAAKAKAAKLMSEPKRKMVVPAILMRVQRVSAASVSSE